MLGSCKSLLSVIRIVNRQGETWPNRRNRTNRSARIDLARSLEQCDYLRIE